jgi:hypothetical protein
MNSWTVELMNSWTDDFLHLRWVHLYYIYLDCLKTICVIWESTLLNSRLRIFYWPNVGLNIDVLFISAAAKVTDVHGLYVADMSSHLAFSNSQRNAFLRCILFNADLLFGTSRLAGCACSRPIGRDQISVHIDRSRQHSGQKRIFLQWQVRT